LTVDSTDEETTYTDTLSKNDEIQYYVRVSNVVANTAVLSNKITINSNNENSTDNNSNSNEELRKWWY